MRERLKTQPPPAPAPRRLAAVWAWMLRDCRAGGGRLAVAESLPPSLPPHLAEWRRYLPPAGRPARRYSSALHSRRRRQCRKATGRGSGRAGDVMRPPPPRLSNSPAGLSRELAACKPAGHGGQSSQAIHSMTGLRSTDGVPSNSYVQSPSPPPTHSPPGNPRITHPSLAPCNQSNT